ncbi:hypothetical protein ACIBH1_12005 [Nonomuraea sp. NPDC050663]|uniref:hypothetical protein n=1 Tax=Nonomuraea sp. NPDC050663 TaxID=3364370 RepID=UPI0037B471E9
METFTGLRMNRFERLVRVVRERGGAGPGKGCGPGRPWCLALPEQVLLVTERGLKVRFGPWQVATGLDNLRSVQVTGPYHALRGIGPHLSLADCGLSFGTNTRRGLCLTFHQPVRGGEPTGLLRHPGLTITVGDPDALAQILRPNLTM